MKHTNKKLEMDNVSVNTENLSVVDLLKLRMMKVKPKLESRYMPVYEHYFGTQSSEQRQKIRECVNLRDADEQITINIEKMAGIKEKRDRDLAEAAQLAPEISNNTFKRKNIVKK